MLHNEKKRGFFLFTKASLYYLSKTYRPIRFSNLCAHQGQTWEYILLKVEYREMASSPNVIASV